MKAIVSPSSLSGVITAPASKSAMQRACAAALIKGGKTILYNPGISADDKAALDIIKQLGALVDFEVDRVIITSDGIKPASKEIHCGESGLSVRMFTSIAAISSEKITITGGGSLIKRPLDFFEEVFPGLGVAIESNKGLLPLTIKGPLQPKTITVDGSLSSQFLTGLLFAYAATNASDVSIYVDNLNSKPYVDLTLGILHSFGLKTPINKGYKEFYFESNEQNNIAALVQYSVESDWSNTAFLLVAGAIAGNIQIEGIDLRSAQGDKKIIEVLQRAGSFFSIDGSVVKIETSHLRPFYFDATDCPDLFPPLVALASYCDGISQIKGVNRLTHKESNRAESLQKEFGKLNVSINIEDDLMFVNGGDILTGATVSSHNDHRIAMACAVAALKAEGESTILDAQAVNKSYPNFWQHMQQLGSNISLTDNK